MLTTCELLQIQDGSQGKNSIQIVPILESTKLSKLEGPGIEIKSIRKPEYKKLKNEKLCKGLSFKHPDNNGIWFQIRNATNISHLIKVFDNQTIWKQQCTFPCHTIAACYCNGVIIVSLCDNTLNFIDSLTGCTCLPSIFLSNGTKYLQRIGDKRIALLTENNQLFIWEIDPNTIPKCVIKVNFYGNLDKIRYIELTQELETKQLSPIIQTETKRYRYSIKRQCWTLPEYEYKPPFSKEDNFETLDDVIKNFGYSLLTHDQVLMEKTYLIMLKETPYECVIRLINYYNVGIKEVSGIWLSDVLKHAFDHLVTNYPDISEKVAKSKEYKKYAPETEEEEEKEEENQNDNNTNNNLSYVSNASSNENLILNNNLTNTSTSIANNTSSEVSNNNIYTDISLQNSSTNNQIVKRNRKVRKVPTIELDEINRRNTFDDKIFSPLANDKEFFYSFNDPYDDYIKQANKKDPKIGKFIEAFSYSSNEQKEIARKLKLKLPSKRRGKSLDKDKKDDTEEKTKKKKKKHFIKPEILHKKSSHSNTPTMQPLNLTQYQPGQPMQQIQQMQYIPNMPIQFQFLQNKNNANLPFQTQVPSAQLQGTQVAQRQILQQQNNSDIYQKFVSELAINPQIQRRNINKSFKQEQQLQKKQNQQIPQTNQQMQIQQSQSQQINLQISKPPQTLIQQHFQQLAHMAQQSIKQSQNQIQIQPQAQQQLNKQNTQSQQILIQPQIQPQIQQHQQLQVQQIQQQQIQPQVQVQPKQQVQVQQQQQQQVQVTPQVQHQVQVQQQQFQVQPQQQPQTQVQVQQQAQIQVQPQIHAQAQTQQQVQVQPQVQQQIQIQPQIHTQAQQQQQVQIQVQPQIHAQAQQQQQVQVQPQVQVQQPPPQIIPQIQPQLQSPTRKTQAKRSYRVAKQITSQVTQQQSTEPPPAQSMPPPQAKAQPNPPQPSPAVAQMQPPVKVRPKSPVFSISSPNSSSNNGEQPEQPEVSNLQSIQQQNPTAPNSPNVQKQTQQNSTLISSMSQQTTPIRRKVQKGQSQTNRKQTTLDFLMNQSEKKNAKK